MKEWFKYEFGYVNIDDENIYLTSSGNWSETKNLTQKTPKVVRKNNRRSTSIIVFIVATLILLGIIIYRSLLNEKLGIFLILLSIAGGYKLYSYLKTEIGSKLKIPFHKVSAIKIEKNRVELHYTNGEEIEDIEELYKVENKGIDILSGIRDSM